MGWALREHVCGWASLLPPPLVRTRPTCLAATSPTPCLLAWRCSAPAPSRSYSGGGGGGPNIYVAPPVYGYGMSPFGFGVPFFGGGFGYGVPLFGGFSFIFNIMIFL